MRFIFHNPHVEIWYKTPFYHYLTKRVSVQKYIHLFNYCLKKNEKITVLIDTYGSSFNNKFIRKLFPAILEFYIWVLINRMNPFKFRILTNYKHLNKDDVLFMFVYGNLTSQSGTFSFPIERFTKELEQTKAFKVVHLTHYMYHASLGSLHCKNALIDLFVAENNLSKNSSFFRKYYRWYTNDVYCMPFVPKDRYRSTVIFSERKNKAIATGTITHAMKDTDFINFFEHDNIHPIRSQIYLHKEELATYIDSFISEITEGKHLTPLSKIEFINQFYRIFYDIFISKQKEYFKMNIVEKYNEYKMFIVPEEINDLPGIGFVEGMSCGCAFIGKEDPMYADIGMINNINYIGYDGSIADLITKIEYYQLHPEELEKIASNGKLFIHSYINENYVCENFFNYLENTLADKE